MSDSVWPQRRQPTRVPCPWDSPGKNTGVGCHFLLQCMKVKSESEVAQSCPTLTDPMDCSLSGSSVHGIFQARVLAWGSIAFSGEWVLVTSNIHSLHFFLGTEMSVLNNGLWAEIMAIFRPVPLNFHLNRITRGQRRGDPKMAVLDPWMTNEITIPPPLP